MAAEPDADPAPSVRVSDPEDYNQTQRLRAINQARQRVEDTIEQSAIWQVSNEGFGESDRQQVVRAALYSYLTNIEWLMVEAESFDLLRHLELGTIRLDPPDTFMQLASAEHQGFPRLIGYPALEPFEVSITGVEGYLTAPEVFEKTWTVQIEHRHTRPGSVSKTEETYMPVHISLNAFRAANKFLSTAGIDVDLAEEQHRVVIDEEALKEVEQWRKQQGL